MSKNTFDNNDAATKKRQLRNGLIKLVSIILASFVGFLGAVVGVMYLTGAFDPVIIYPSGISFEHTLYEPTLTYDEDGNLINYFYVKVLGEPEKITEKEINLSVGDSYVITLEKTTANIGEDIKVFITTEDGKLPNGGATTITARAGGSGIYGSASCNVFIDRPVTEIEIQTSKTNATNSQSLYINEVINVFEPTFYPARSKNPSIVDENQGNEIVSKPNKSYIYILEFEFKQPGVDGDVYRWVDVDNLSDPANTESNRVVKWANSQKTQIVALKEGRFRLLCHAFSTYKVQEEEVTEETVDQKKLRMSIFDGYDEEQIFTVTEVNLNSIESKNYNSTSTPLDFEYKKEYKLYLRSNSSISQLASKRAYNVDIAINPQEGYGLNYTAMYGKVKDIYLTTNLQNQDSVIKITGRTVVDEDNITRIYPLIDNEWESFPDDQKEYYYIITVVGKSSNFAFDFHIINPNDGVELTTSVSASVSEVQTTEFNFNEGPYTENDLRVNIDANGDHTRNTMKATIDPDEPFTVDLYKYITNLSANGKEPTYDKILFYAYVSNSTETFAENLANVNEIISITTTDQNPFILAQDRYGILIENGLLRPIGYGEVTIYAVLVQTDYEGKDVINPVTGTYAIKLASIKLSVETILKQVRVQIRENNSNEVVEEYLNENYIYKLALQPTYNGAPVDYKVLDRVIDLIEVRFTTEYDGLPQVKVDSEFVYDSINGYHYCMISIPSSSLNNYAKDLQCSVYFNGKLIGNTIQYEIHDTAVKSVTLIVESEDKTDKTDFVYKAEVSGSEIVWREVYTDAEGKSAVGGQFDFRVAIDGLNQNYNLTSSDPTSISIYSDNGLQKLKFLKPTNGFVTITCESVENSNVKDVIRIKLEESQFVFEAKNMTVSNGEIYNSSDTYTETVYKDYKVNVFNLVTVKFNNEVFNNLATLRFSTATNNAILANYDGENGLSTAGDVYFTHNVGKSEFITVEIVTPFGDILRYRFVLKNNLAPTIEFKNVENINSDPNMVNQNQAVVSEYNGKLYMTMVYAQGNTINVKDLIALNHQEDITKVFTNQYIQNELRFGVGNVGMGSYVSVNSITGVVTYSNSGLNKVTEPTLISLTMYETDLIDKSLGYIDGNTILVYSFSFEILLVPNIMVEKVVKPITEGGENYTVYQAGKYLFTNESFASEYDFTEISNTVQNLEIPYANFFAVRDFRGSIIDNAVVKYSIPQDSFASLTSTGVLINPDSLYVSKVLDIVLTYTNFIDYTASVSITINPYYQIGYNTQNTECYIQNGDDEYVLIHVEQKIELYSVISIKNDTNNVKKDALTYHIRTTEYINIRESNNSLSAYINGLKFSGEEFSYVEVYLDNKPTGFVIKVKAIENVDFANYGVDEVAISEVLQNKIIEDEVGYWKAYAGQTLDVTKVFIANKYTPKDNRLSMIYSFHIYQPATDTYIEDTNNNYIVLTNNNIIFKEVAETTKVLIRAKSDEYDEEDGVYPLEFIVEIQKSQGWQWTYPIEDNDIHELDFDREQLLSNWNNDLIKGVSKERLEDVLFDDSFAYADVNYRELQPGDTFNISDVLQVYDILSDGQGGVVNVPFTTNEMLSFVNIKFIDYDFDSSSWVTSSHVMISGNTVTIRNNVSVPTLTFMVVTSNNGMLDVYKLYILTKETVNSKENISVTIAYPSNSSNYYLDETDNKYEHINLESYNTILTQYVDADNTSYYGINLTSVSNGGNGNRRISASLNSQDVTSTLRFKLYVEVLDHTTNTFSPLSDPTYFQPVIIGQYLALTDGRFNALPEDTRITISIYNSYEKDFGVYYYLWIGDDLLVNFNVNESIIQLSGTIGGVVENFTYKYRNIFTYTDGNMYNIKDFINFTRLDGSNIADDKITYYIAEVSDFEVENGNIIGYGDDLTKQSTAQIVLIQDGGKFSITRLAAMEGTPIVIKCKIQLSEDVDDYTVIYYPIIVKSSGVESSNPDATVNSSENPYVVSYNSDVMQGPASGTINPTDYNLFEKKGDEGSAQTTTFIDILSIAELENDLGKNLNVDDLVLDLDSLSLTSSNSSLVTTTKADDEVGRITVPEWLQNKEFSILTGGRKYAFNYSQETGDICWVTVQEPCLIIDNFAYLSRAQIEEIDGEFQIRDHRNTVYTKSGSSWLNNGNPLPNAHEQDGYVYYDCAEQEEGKTIEVYEDTYTYIDGKWSRTVNNLNIPIFKIRVLSDVTTETLVTLTITAKWKDFENNTELASSEFKYYVKVVPEYSVSVSNSNYSQNVYSYHEYDVLNNDNSTRFIFSRFNNEMGKYDDIDFNTAFNDENSNYQLVALDEDKNTILNPSEYEGLLSFLGSKITFKGVLNQEKITVGIAYDSDLTNHDNQLYIYPNVYIDFYINYNFTPNDILVINENGTDNSDSNTYKINSNVLLSDIISISRFVDSDIASAYMEDFIVQQAMIFETFSFESTLFDGTKSILMVNDGVISVNPEFLTAESYNANLVIKLRGVYLTTIYFTIQANYSFSINNASATVYVGQEIDLTNLGKSFMGNDGSEVVGGTMSFQALDDGININNDIVVFDNVGNYKILVTYKKGNNTYIGTIDFNVESKFNIVVNNDFIVIDSITYEEGSSNTLAIEEKERFIQNFTFYYEGELMETPEISEVEFDLTDISLKQNADDFQVYNKIVKVKITYNLISAYFYVCIDTEKYYYNSNNDLEITTVVGGNKVDLTTMLDTTYNSNDQEVKVNTSQTIRFKVVNPKDGEEYEGNYYTTGLTTEVESRDVIYRMQGTNGEYYYGLMTLTVLPSFKINAIHNIPAQEITTVAVGEKFNIHDQISFSMQDGLNNPILASSLTSETKREYTYQLFNTTGYEVTQNLPLKDDLNGNLEFTIGALNYTLIVEYKFIYQPKDGASQTLETVYYQILVQGVDYYFTTTDKPEYELGNTLVVSNFGAFNIASKDDKYLFTAVGSYYSVSTSGVITASNVLYDTECDVLISLVKTIDEKEYTFSTVQKFILKQTYDIAYHIIDGNINKEFERNVFAQYNASMSGGTTNLIDSTYYEFNAARQESMIDLVDSVTISTNVNGVAYNYIYNINKNIDYGTGSVSYEIVPTVNDSDVESIYKLGVDGSSLNFYTLYHNNVYALDGASVKFLIKFKAEDQTKFIDFTISYNTTTKTGSFSYADNNDIVFEYGKTVINLNKDKFNISDVEEVKIIASSNLPQLDIKDIIDTKNNMSITITVPNLYGDNIEGAIYFDLYNLQTNTYVASCSKKVKITCYNITPNENLNKSDIYANATVRLNTFTYDSTIYTLDIEYKVYDYTGNKVNDNSKYINVNQDNIIFKRSPNGKDFTFVIEYTFSSSKLVNFTSITYSKVYKVQAPTYELGDDKNNSLANNLITLNGNAIKVKLVAKYGDGSSVDQVITGREFRLSSNTSKANLIKSDILTESNTLLQVEFNSIDYSTYVRLIITSEDNGYTVKLPLDISIPSKEGVNNSDTITTSAIETTTKPINISTLGQVMEISVFNTNGTCLINAKPFWSMSGDSINNDYLMFKNGILNLKTYNNIYAVKFKNGEFNGAESYYYKYYTLIDESVNTTIYLNVIDEDFNKVQGFYLDYNEEKYYDLNYSNSLESSSTFIYEVVGDDDYFTATISGNQLTLKSTKATNYLSYLTINIYKKLGNQNKLLYERVFEVYGSSELFNVAEAESSEIEVVIPEDYTADTYNIDLTTFTNNGYSLYDNNNDKVEIKDGIAKFNVPYYIYKVEDNGQVLLDASGKTNSYTATITATKGGTNIALKFKIKTNKSTVLNGKQYTLNELATKYDKLDDIAVAAEEAITKSSLRYNGETLSGSVEFIKLNNINYTISADKSKLTVHSAVNDFYCLVKCNNKFYLQKFIVKDNNSIISIQIKDLYVDNNFNSDGAYSGITVSIENNQDGSVDTQFVIDNNFKTNKTKFLLDVVTTEFMVDGEDYSIYGNQLFPLTIPGYSYSIENGQLVETAPVEYSVKLSVKGQSGAYKDFNITIINESTNNKDGYNNSKVVKLNDLTASDGSASVEFLELSNEFIIDTNYFNNDGTLKGDVSFIELVGSQMTLSQDGKTMIFYNSGNYNLIVKQTINGSDKYYVVKVKVDTPANKSGVETIVKYKYNKVGNTFTIKNDTTTLETVVNTVLGQGTYKNDFKVISSGSVPVNSNIIDFPQSDFDKYGYIHVYSPSDATYYVINVRRESSGLVVTENNEVVLAQINIPTEIGTAETVNQLDLYDAFNDLNQGENKSITNEILIKYIKYKFSRREIISITRTGNKFEIAQKGIKQGITYKNTVVLQRQVEVITDDYTITASTKFVKFVNTEHTPISDNPAVKINSDNSIEFMPVLTDTEIFIKVESKVGTTNGVDIINVQFVKFILLSDTVAYNNLLKDFAVQDVAKEEKYTLKFSDTTNYTYKNGASSIPTSGYVFNATGNYGYHYVEFTVTDKYGNSIDLIKTFNVVVKSTSEPIIFTQNVFSVGGTSIDLTTVVSVTSNITPSFTITSGSINGKVTITGTTLNYNFYHFNEYVVTINAKVGASVFVFNLILKSNIDKSLFASNSTDTTFGVVGASSNIKLFNSALDVNVGVEIKNSKGNTLTQSTDYSFVGKQIINLHAINNGDYIINITITDDCGVEYKYNRSFTVNEATAQFLEYTANNVVIKSGEILKLTKDGDTQANNHIGVFKLLAANIDGIELEEVVLNDLVYMNFELRYNGTELTIVELQSIQAGHVLYDTTVQVEVILKDGINVYIGYLNVTIKGDYLFENKVQDNFRVDFETDFTLDSLITVIQNGDDITSTLTSISDLATTIEIIDYVTSKPSNDITYDETTQIFRVLNAASGKVYIARMKFATEDQIKIIDIVINVNEKIYSFNFKNDMFTIYSGESINLNDLVGQFIDIDGYVISIGERPTLTFELENAENIPFIKLENNTLTSKGILENVTVRVKVSEQYGRVGYLTITILSHFDTLVDIANNSDDNNNNDVVVENGIIKLNVGESVNLLPRIIDTLDSGYAHGFVIEYRINNSQLIKLDLDKPCAFAPDNSLLGKTSIIEFIISVQDESGNKYQSVLITQQIYTYNRIMKFVGTNGNLIIADRFDIDIATLIEFYYENDLEDSIEAVPNDYKLYLNLNGGTIELNRDAEEYTNVTYNNNEIMYKVDGNILSFDMSLATSNILLSIQIVDKYTGNSVTYTCIVNCV